MKLAVFEAEPWVRSAWQLVEGKHEIILIEECLTAANVADYTGVDIISIDMSVLDEKLLDNFDRLRFVATRSTGVDQIDLKYCKKHGITVSNVPAYAENAVAEHVFALLFAISRHIVEAVGRTRKSDFSWEGIQGFELRGKTLAVIGTGAIGRRVSEIAQGFGMKVVASECYCHTALRVFFKGSRKSSSGSHDCEH
jgi:D-lactate dehydrogenase